MAKVTDQDIQDQMDALEGRARGNRYDELVTQFNKTGIEAQSRQSQEWFLKNVRKLQGLNPNSLLRNKRRSVGDMLPQRLPGLIGNMFMYTYSPKGKKTLPYWDRFPLVMPMEQYKDGILAINFHYLPPRIRATLLNRLLLHVTDNRFDQKTRIRMSYNVLNSTQRFKHFRPTIKRYLNSHIQSNIIKIPSNEWELAIFLPTEQFTGASKLKVWADSRKKWNKQ